MSHLTQSLLPTLQHDRDLNRTPGTCSQVLFRLEKFRHQTPGSPAVIVMNSLKLVVPPQPILALKSQRAQLPSDIGHVGHEQQVNNQPRTHSDGVLRRQADRPATPTVKHSSKVDVEGKQGPPQKARKSRRETLRTILAVVSDFFKRSRTQNATAEAVVHPEIDQLRREITALQNRCANLEGTNYSAYGSRRSSTLDIPQGLREPGMQISQSILSLPEDSEYIRATTNVVVQASVSFLETDDQTAPPRQVQLPAGTEGHVEAKDIDLAIRPTMSLRAAKDELSSLPLDQNQSGVTRGGTAPARAEREEGLSKADKVLGVQFSQTGQQKLPRKKKEDEKQDPDITVELEARSGFTDQQKLPRKRHGNEELEVEALPPYFHQERLPRKKESEE